MLQNLSLQECIKALKGNYYWLQEHSIDNTSEHCQDDLCQCLCDDYLADVPECQGDVGQLCRA